MAFGLKLHSQAAADDGSVFNWDLENGRGVSEATREATRVLTRAPCHTGGFQQLGVLFRGAYVKDHSNYLWVCFWGSIFGNSQVSDL